MLIVERGVTFSNVRKYLDRTRLQPENTQAEIARQLMTPYVLISSSGCRGREKEGEREGRDRVRGREETMREEERDRQRKRRS